MGELGEEIAPPIYLSDRNVLGEKWIRRKQWSKTEEKQGCGDALFIDWSGDLHAAEGARIGGITVAVPSHTRYG